jgi:hypothetical protein
MLEKHRHSVLFCPTLGDYLASIDILDQRVLFHCSMERRPLTEVSRWLGVTPQYITSVLLESLAFTEAVFDAGEGRATALISALASQTETYLLRQQSAIPAASMVPD